VNRSQVIVIVIAAVLLAGGLVVTIRNSVAASATAYSWVAYGDVRPSSGATNSPYSSGWTHVRDKVIATSHAFDVVPGDLVQGLGGTDTLANDLAKYDWLFKNMGTEQSVPHVYAPGNHENFAAANYRSAWQQKINNAHYRTYSYGAGTVASPRTFVVQLSTEEPGYSGRIGLVSETSTSNSPQATWLVQTLQREAWNANEYIVVLFHRPLADPKPGETMSDKTAVENLFTKYGVDLVINAHVHVYVRHTMPNGAPYLIVGNGGASLYAVGSWTSTTPGTDVKSVVGSYGFVHFSAHTDGTMDATVSSVKPSTWAWTTSDTFTVPQTKPTTASPTGTPTPTPTTTPTPTPMPTSSASPSLLSLNAPATATSTATGYPAGYADDGLLSTRWNAVDSTYPQNLTLDLGAAHTVTSVSLSIYNSTTTPRSYGISILGSNDGTTWTSLVSGWSVQGSGTKAVTSTTKWRYVRARFDSSSPTGMRASAWEVQVFGQ
jgi:hypothetical protein